METISKTKLAIVYGVTIATILGGSYIFADRPVADLKKTKQKIYNEEQYQDLAKEIVNKIEKGEELTGFGDVDLYFDVINEELKREGKLSTSSGDILKSVNKLIKDKYQ